jgi:hypothetical protein
MIFRRNTGRPGVLRRPRALFTLGAIGILAAATTASASTGAAPSAGSSASTSPVHVTVLTPARSGVAGRNGVFNVDIKLSADHSRGGPLSAAAGYRPFLNSPDSPTFGPGKPDPGAPGLVVLLSTTPQAAGGPHANLAGVFQLNAVDRVNGQDRTFNDWQVTAPGFFGKNVDAVLTVFVVTGRAPGVVNMSRVHPISNVVHVPFHIAG